MKWKGGHRNSLEGIKDVKEGYVKEVNHSFCLKI